jgi:hypothetical protein
VLLCVLLSPAGFGAAAFMAPLLQNLCLSKGDNEEACYCLKVRRTAAYCLMDSLVAGV